jgi:hypothetical protein
LARGLDCIDIDEALVQLRVVMALIVDSYWLWKLILSVVGVKLFECDLRPLRTGCLLFKRLRRCSGRGEQ